jgi:hypothetical protein
MAIVKFRLIRNPKAAQSGTGLLHLVRDSKVQGGGVQDSNVQDSNVRDDRVRDSKFEWVRPLQRDYTSATYELGPGFYVLVTDESSHKNKRKNWTIIQVFRKKDGTEAVVVREEAKVWRENKVWGCYWWGKRGSYGLIAQIASEYKGRQAKDMSVIEILDAFFECAIQRLEAEEAKRRRDEPPPGN